MIFTVWYIHIRDEMDIAPGANVCRTEFLLNYHIMTSRMKRDSSGMLHFTYTYSVQASFSRIHIEGQMDANATLGDCEIYFMKVRAF